MGNSHKSKGICPSNRNFSQIGVVPQTRTTMEKKMTARPTFRHLDIPFNEKQTSIIPFEMQPIVQIADGSVKAWELLYRGARPVDWSAVDAAVINYLSTPRPDLPPLYVNLSNEVLMSESGPDLAQVVSANDVTFELSEAVSGHSDRAAIADKVNQLIDVGARVALDDFGAGRDGFERLYAIRNVAAVKIDREFLLTCMRRTDACRMLSMLVAQWRREGIKSIAEGVETAKMLMFAQSVNVDLAQGWYLDAAVGMSQAR